MDDNVKVGAVVFGPTQVKNVAEVITKAVVDSIKAENAELRTRADRYRKALEEIAGAAAVGERMHPEMGFGILGVTARRALEEK